MLTVQEGQAETAPVPQEEGKVGEPGKVEDIPQEEGKDASPEEEAGSVDSAVKIRQQRDPSTVTPTSVSEL